MTPRSIAVTTLAILACSKAPPTPVQTTTCPSLTSVASTSSAPIDETKPKTPEEALVRFWKSPSASPSWFAPSFLAAVPFAQIEPIRQQLSKGLGAFDHVEKTGPGFTCVFANGTVPAKAKLDDEGRFTTLWFGNPETGKKTLDQAVNEITARKGKTSVLVMEGSTERVAKNADEPLAVGSTFKLAILATLRAQIDAKKRAWSDVVTLEAKNKSLPSGTLQTWPDGTALTLQSLATSMISVSDNTATDTLLALVGRDAVEPLAPHAQPFLSTREAFVLKSKKNDDLLQKWRSGDDAAKRALLPQIDARPLPTVEELDEKPTALDVEWTFTARELCALMAKVQDLGLTSVNPGVVKKEDWDRVAYKGGSEPGVLSTTSWLVAGSKSYCVSATWNDPAAALDELSFFGSYAALTKALHP